MRPVRSKPLLGHPVFFSADKGHLSSACANYFWPKERNVERTMSSKVHYVVSTDFLDDVWFVCGIVAFVAFVYRSAAFVPGAVVLGVHTLLLLLLQTLAQEFMSNLTLILLLTSITCEFEPKPKMLSNIHTLYIQSYNVQYSV